jgi:hypothetical protein
MQLRTILLENLRHVSAVDGSAVEVDPAVLTQQAALSAGQVGVDTIIAFGFRGCGRVLAGQVSVGECVGGQHSQSTAVVNSGGGVGGPGSADSAGSTVCRTGRFVCGCRRGRGRPA